MRDELDEVRIVAKRKLQRVGGAHRCDSHEVLSSGATSTRRTSTSACRKAYTPVMLAVITPASGIAIRNHGQNCRYHGLTCGRAGNVSRDAVFICARVRRI